ncbi:MAG: hypothetical protein ACPGYV_07675 [Phycisphaeraceae bacterium]
MPDRSEPNAAEALFCPSCMYDLRGGAGEACPECGFDLGDDSVGRSSIPWAYRQKLNAPLLLVTTAWRACRRPRLFCMALARPAERRDALQFRLAVVWSVWLVVAACWSLAVWDDASLYLELDFWEDEVTWLADYDDHLEALADLGPRLVWFNVGFGALFWLWLYLATGVQTYFAHRPGASDALDRRAVSLAYYACGPALLLIVPAVVMLASGYVYEYAEDVAGLDELVSLAGWLFWGSWAMAVSVGGLCLWTGVRFAGLLSGGGLGRQLLTAGGLLVAWLGLGLLVFGVLPGVALFLYFVFATI